METFQSTLPVGGATITPIAHSPDIDISIHAPRGGSDVITDKSISPKGKFQSTLPVGGATTHSVNQGCKGLFQSTLPVGGATITLHNYTSKSVISIHAPRGGSDDYHATVCRLFRYFNPRSPWGERPASDIPSSSPRKFQSTLPVGGATFCCVRFSGKVLISIHAPRGGSDGKDAQISGSIFGKDIKFVRHNPGKVVPNRLKKRWHLHRFPKKSRANLPGFSVHLRFALQNQGILRQIGVLAAEMLNFLFVLIPQIVETEAVLFRIHDGQKLCL